MRRTTVIALSVAAAVGAAACSERSPSGPGDTSLNPPPAVPAGMVVSNARASSGPAGSVELRSSLTLSANTVAYVSALPGTFPGAASVSLRNQTRGTTSQSLQVVDGGFDPVGVNAEEGDELSLRVFDTAGGSTVSAVKVPARRRPGVVRTNPAKGRTDVALNVQVLVVFSEPVDISTVTSSSVTLLKDGSAVPGHVQVAADGLSAEFVPDSPLQSETSYTLVIKESIHDLDGDALADASTVSFLTVAPVPGGQLAFVQSGQIYRTNADGTRISALTKSGVDGWPAWSPDGRRIAFSRITPFPNGQSAYDIYLLNADGSNLVQRTAGANYISVAWSPDGQKLAISEEGTAYSDIHIISADDDGARATLLATPARSPAWSPDGKKIAYVRLTGDDDNDQIILLSADGTDARELTGNDGWIYGGLSWSPNGQRLAFSKCISGRGCDLHVMSADGSQLRRITEVGNTSGAAWSPDGKWIAFTVWNVVEGKGQPSVAYVPSEGGTPRVIFVGGRSPSWRP